MRTRSLAMVLFAMVACSRSPKDAGIVLNVDAEVVADRAVIDRISVTVDGTRQEWQLTQPLPGSLGIFTSPGNKSVVVEGISHLVVRGRWSKVVSAVKGQVVVLDVHLAPVDGVDAGADPRDGGAREDAGRDALHWDAIDAGVLDRLVDAAPVDAGLGRDASGQDGQGELGRDASAERSDLAGNETAAPWDAPASDAPALPLKGSFAVASDFVIPATSAATGQLADTLALTHRFVDDPGTAILGLAQDAQSSELTTLLSALPDALESQLAGWMSAYIRTASSNGVTPYDRLVSLDSTVRALLLSWRLQSTLALPSGAAGTHAPTAFVFSANTGPVTIPIDPALVTPGTGIVATLLPPDVASGAAKLTLSDHSMALPFGRYALPALNAVLLASNGVPNTAAYLSSAVDCPELAKSVASHCVSIVCVGHTSELSAVCAAGLAEGARQIEARILALDFKALRFELGIATPVGAQVSVGQATRLDDGVWTSTVDFGDGARAANATFSAVTAN